MANFILALVAALALLHTASAEDPGLLQRASFLKTLIASNSGVQSDEICNNRARTCADDCSSYVECTNIGSRNSPIWIHLGERFCAAGTYCDDDQESTCVKDIPAKCATPRPSKDHSCSGTGYFPDVTSCTKFYFCNEKLEPYASDCADLYPGTVWDSKTTQCVYSTSSTATCVKVTCSGSLRIQAWSSDKRYYAICRDSDPKNAVIAKCPDYQTLSPSSAQCEDACAESGRLPVRGDPLSYVECVAVGSKMSAPTKRQCPPGSAFNAALQQCVIPEAKEDE